MEFTIRKVRNGYIITVKRQPCGMADPKSTDEHVALGLKQAMALINDLLMNRFMNDETK